MNNCSAIDKSRRALYFSRNHGTKWSYEGMRDTSNDAHSIIPHFYQGGKFGAIFALSRKDADILQWKGRSTFAQRIKRSVKGANNVYPCYQNIFRLERFCCNENFCVLLYLKPVKILWRRGNVSWSHKNRKLFLTDGKYQTYVVCCRKGSGRGLGYAKRKRNRKTDN